MNWNTNPGLRRIDACGAAAAAVILAIGYLTVMRPAVSSQLRVRQDRESLAELRQQALDRSAEWRSIQQQLQAIDRSIASMPFTLRPATQINTQLAEVVELAKTSGLNVLDMSPGPAVTSKRYVSIPIRLRGTGGFPAATSFLNELHSRFVDTRVNSFTLSADLGAVDGDSSFTFDLTWHAVPAGSAADAGSAGGN